MPYRRRLSLAVQNERFVQVSEKTTSGQHPDLTLDLAVIDLDNGLTQLSRPRRSASAVHGRSPSIIARMAAVCLVEFSGADEVLVIVFFDARDGEPASVGRLRGDAEHGSDMVAHPWTGPQDVEHVLPTDAGRGPWFSRQSPAGCGRRSREGSLPDQARADRPARRDRRSRIGSRRRVRIVAWLAPDGCGPWR